MVLGVVWLGTRLISSSRLQRLQIGIALLASLVVLLGNLIYVSPINPVPGLDWTPFSFTIAGLLFALSLFRYKLMKIMPIAQQAMFERLEDLILVFDGQERVIDMNPAAEKILGTLGWRSAGLHISKFLPELAAEVAAGEDPQKTHHLELRLGKEPDRLDYEVRVTPLGEAHSPRMGRLVVLHDVTQRKLEKELLRQARDELEVRVTERTEELRRANAQISAELEQRKQVEEALNESESTYRALFENANDPILLLHPDGTIWKVNQKAADLLGYTPNELVGAQPDDYMAPEDYPDRRRKIKAALDGYNVPTFERRYRMKDGTVVLTEVNIAVVRDLEGKPKFIQVIARDIRERKAIELEHLRLLEEVSQSREQLRALAARLQEVQEFERHQIATELHDRVGQNLTGLGLNLQIVHNQAPPECTEVLKSRLEDSLRLVEETTRQVRDVMADLLPPMLDEFGLASALRWYSSEFTRRTTINTQVSGQDEPRLGRSVEIALFRIAQEALNNIARHSGATQVFVEMENGGTTACLKIEDNGQGFDLAQLGSPGERLHLGLITMKERAAAAGGQLAVQSAPGKGTTIVVEIAGSKK
jgi:PAS domain S-box-containing protein